MSIGLFLLLVFSYPFFSRVILGKIEATYPAHSLHPHEGRPDSSGARDFSWIVVLGGGVISDSRVPSSGQINEGALVRLVEGVTQLNRYPSSCLLVSGSGVYDPLSSAEVMYRVARNLGVDETRIVRQPNGWDTYGEAKGTKPYVGEEPFLLVTSASHMPRAVGIYRSLGMKPVPAPTHHQIRIPPKIRPLGIYPSRDNLQKSTTAIYEVLGLMWEKVRGRR